MAAQLIDRTGGDLLLAALPVDARTADVRRFCRHVGLGPTVDPALGPCLLWTGARKDSGYGVFWSHSRRKGKRGLTVLAHRWLYEQVTGRKLGHLTLDHRCEVEACVNPRHLRPMCRELNRYLQHAKSARRFLRAGPSWRDPIWYPSTHPLSPHYVESKAVSAVVAA